MYVIRPIRIEDLDGLEKLAFSANLGITSMPRNRKLLEQKIQRSIQAFSTPLETPGQEDYLFILEHAATQEVGGVSGIFSKTGVDEPCYFYRMENQHPTSRMLTLPDELQLLQPVIYRNGPSEICSLYLSPLFRKGGLGRLLSLSRFLYIANHPERFEPVMISEMRGVVDANNHAPFWDGLGRHFLDIEFWDLMTLLEGGKHFIPEILPKYPIYTTLLPKEAQEAIGKTHPNTRPALQILLDEGFSPTDEVDIFDGGPKIMARTAEIRTVKTSVVGTVGQIGETAIESERYILSSDKREFRACFGHVKPLEDGEVAITPEAAKSLEVELGDKVRFASASAQNTKKEKDLCRETTIST